MSRVEFIRSRDNLTPEQRRRTMQAVKGRDTSPELLLRRALWAAGMRGWRTHRPSLPGRPDIAFGGSRVAVFVDGGFWHGHPTRYWQGRTSDYWDTKIARNQARDRRVDEQLRELGWTSLRIWDFEVAADPPAAAARVLNAVDAAVNCPLSVD
jgi:DNA mismatch endonuclease (patch repair protein)